MAAGGGDTPREAGLGFNRLIDSREKMMASLATWIWLGRRRGLRLFPPGLLLARRPAAAGVWPETGWRERVVVHEGGSTGVYNSAGKGINVSEVQVGSVKIEGCRTEEETHYGQKIEEITQWTDVGRAF